MKAKTFEFKLYEPMVPTIQAAKFTPGMEDEWLGLGPEPAYEVLCRADSEATVRRAVPHAAFIGPALHGAPIPDRIVPFGSYLTVTSSGKFHVTSEVEFESQYVEVVIADVPPEAEQEIVKPSPIDVPRRGKGTRKP